MKYAFAMKEGDKIAILRPDDPELALRMMRDAVEIEDDSARELAFRNILTAQMHSFVGLVATVGKPDRKLLNEKGWAIGYCRPGDSMVPYAVIQGAAEKAAAKLAENPSVIQPDEVRMGDGEMGLKLMVQTDGTLGALSPTTEEIVVDSGTGPEKMKIGTWSAKCACGGAVTAIYDANEKPDGLVHADPPCADFVKMDPLEYVSWLNAKNREGSN